MVLLPKWFYYHRLSTHMDHDLKKGDHHPVRPNISPSPPGPSPSWAWPRRSSSAPSARPWRNTPSTWTHKARRLGGPEDGKMGKTYENNRKPWENLGLEQKNGLIDGWWVHFFWGSRNICLDFLNKALGYETPRIQQNGLICTSKHGDHSGTVRRFRLICILADNKELAVWSVTWTSHAHGMRWELRHSKSTCKFKGYFWCGLKRRQAVSICELLLLLG